MTAEEKKRLDEKFREVIELNRMQGLQREAVVASERVMEIFKHRFTNGQQVREIKMHYDEIWADTATFLVKAEDGKFYREHECFSGNLREALKLAGYSVNEPILAKKVLRILGEYFEIEEGIIRI